MSHTVNPFLVGFIQLFQLFLVLFQRFFQWGENFHPAPIEFTIAIGIADSHGSVCGVDEGIRFWLGIGTPQHIGHGAVFDECH